jgi:hypothetical protein
MLAAMSTTWPIAATHAQCARPGGRCATTTVLAAVRPEPGDHAGADWRRASRVQVRLRLGWVRRRWLARSVGALINAWTAAGWPRTARAADQGGQLTGVNG